MQKLSDKRCYYFSPTLSLYLQMCLKYVCAELRCAASGRWHSTVLYRDELNARNNQTNWVIFRKDSHTNIPSKWFVCFFISCVLFAAWARLVQDFRNFQVFSSCENTLKILIGNLVSVALQFEQLGWVAFVRDPTPRTPNCVHND